jgi:hypothetical protein
MIIEKKIWPEFFNDIKSGEKTFEVRLADFECSPGDTLFLREWDPNTTHYTGRSMKKKVSYVLRTKDIHFWPEEDIERLGLQIIALK